MTNRSVPWIRLRRSALTALFAVAVGAASAPPLAANPGMFAATVACVRQWPTGPVFTVLSRPGNHPTVAAENPTTVAGSVLPATAGATQVPAAARLSPRSLAEIAAPPFAIDAPPSVAVAVTANTRHLAEIDTPASRPLETLRALLTRPDRCASTPGPRSLTVLSPRLLDVLVRVITGHPRVGSGFATSPTRSTSESQPQLEPSTTAPDKADPSSPPPQAPPVHSAPGQTGRISEPFDRTVAAPEPTDPPNHTVEPATIPATPESTMGRYLHRGWLRSMLDRSGGFLLTFDDGPNPTNTPRILDTLRRHDVKAVFFVVGTNVRRHPHLVRRIIDEGHTIGNHSFRHANLTTVSAERVIEEIRATNDLVQSITGVRPTLFRPPYGAVNRRVLELIRSEGMDVLMWSIDPGDWHYQPTRILSNLGTAMRLGRDGTRGGVVVLHDTKAQTAAALDPFLERLAAGGLKPVMLTNGRFHPLAGDPTLFTPGPGVLPPVTAEPARGGAGTARVPATGPAGRPATDRPSPTTVAARPTATPEVADGSVLSSVLQQAGRDRTESPLALLMAQRRQMIATRKDLQTGLARSSHPPTTPAARR